MPNEETARITPAQIVSQEAEENARRVPTNDKETKVGDEKEEDEEEDNASRAESVDYCDGNSDGDEWVHDGSSRRVSEGMLMMGKDGGQAIQIQDETRSQARSRIKIVTVMRQIGRI